MWQYYFITIYVFVVVGFVKPKIGNRNTRKLLALLIPAFVIAAMRGNGMGDYFAYIRYGESIRTIKDVLYKNIGMEVGYKGLCYIINLLHLSRQTVIIVMNAISFCCIYSFIRKYSLDWSMPVLLYLPLYFQFEMHAARTGVAIAIVALGMGHLLDNKIWKFLLYIVIASMFHRTSFIALLLYFVYKINIPVIPGCIFFPLEMLGVKILNIDRIMISAMSFMHLDIFAQKFISYANSNQYGYSLKLFDPRILIALLAFFSCNILIHKKENIDRLCINSVFMYGAIMILFSGHTFIAYRLSSYFYIPFIIEIPRLALKLKPQENSKNQKILVFYTIVILFSVLNLAYASQNPEYIPFFKNGEGLRPWTTNR